MRAAIRRGIRDRGEAEQHPRDRDDCGCGFFVRHLRPLCGSKIESNCFQFISTLEAIAARFDFNVNRSEIEGCGASENAEKQAFPAPQRQNP